MTKKEIKENIRRWCEGHLSVNAEIGLKLERTKNEVWHDLFKERGKMQETIITMYAWLHILTKEEKDEMMEYLDKCFIEVTDSLNG